MIINLLLGKLILLTENDIANKILEKYPMTFRNDNGMGYVGGKKCRNDKGQIIIINPKIIKYGLFPGSSDRIGWTTIKITKEMVGQDIAIFTSIEIKTEGDRLSKEQKRWNKIVRKAGGISEVWKANGYDLIMLEGHEIE